MHQEFWFRLVKSGVSPKSEIQYRKVLGPHPGPSIIHIVMSLCWDVGKKKYVEVDMLNVERPYIYGF